jgi:hypothetical protein
VLADLNDWRRPVGINASKQAGILSDLNRPAGEQNISVSMHVLPGTAESLPGFIKQLREMGYVFAVPR